MAETNKKVKDEERKQSEEKAQSECNGLLECPFCGGLDLSCDGHYVSCDHCGAAGSSVYPALNSKRAKEFWNRRHLTV